MSVAAAVLYGLGVVVLFGLRSSQHRRATGSSGFNGFGAGRGPAARVAGVCFAAAVLAGLTSPVLVATSVLPVLVAGPAAPALAWFGTLLAVAGFGLTVVAQQAMGRSWRIGVDPTDAAHTGRFLPGLGRLSRSAPAAETVSPQRLG